jgi:hypothetical protein
MVVESCDLAAAVVVVGFAGDGVATPASRSRNDSFS